MATSTPTAIPVRPASAAWEQYIDPLKTTPGILRTALVGIWLLAVVFSLTVWQGSERHLEGIKTVEEDAAPSIRADQAIKFNLADMHSHAANELLLPPKIGRMAIGGAPLGSIEPPAVTEYWRRRGQVNENLLAAAQKMPYEGENAPMLALLDGLGRYDDAIGRARALHQQGDADFLVAHRQADEIMRTILLPAADQLTQVNHEELEKGFQNEHGWATWAKIRVAVAALLLLAALAGLQLFLFRRMRRVINPALLAATGLVVVYLFWALIAFSAATASLERAKKDAFDNIAVLELARADAYDANGDKSRWLLVVAHSPRQAKFYENAFQKKADQIAKLPTKTNGDALLKELTQTKKVPQDFNGYLADELRTYTFPNEDTAALETLRAFLVYRGIDDTIRRLEREGKHGEALALCVGTGPGDSNRAFQDFDQALDKTIQINQKYFKDYLGRAKRDLRGFRLIGPPLVALALIGLTFLGLRPRLKEYRLN